MAATSKTLRDMRAPVQRAMIFICEKCGKRAAKEDKHASYKLASQLKRGIKRAYAKGDIRIVLTSCMDACPDEGIAIAFQSMSRGSKPLFLEADVGDVEGGCESLLKLIGRDG